MAPNLSPFRIYVSELSLVAFAVITICDTLATIQILRMESLAFFYRRRGAELINCSGKEHTPLN